VSETLLGAGRRLIASALVGLRFEQPSMLFHPILCLSFSSSCETQDVQSMGTG
jgi:hypothetical protein